MAIRQGATHLVGDIRPQSHRRRIETPSLRGVNIQRLFGSQRVMKSVEDFTEFEQRAAYFDGDQVSAAAKGVNPLERRQPGSLHGGVSGLLEFPPTPALSWDGKLDPQKFASDSAEMKGQSLFFGKARCAECHPAPFYTDNLMHDLRVERFHKTQTINGLVATAQGPIKTFPCAASKSRPLTSTTDGYLRSTTRSSFSTLSSNSNLMPRRSSVVAFLQQL